MATKKTTEVKPEENAKVYPIKKADGWFIEDEGDEMMGIETMHYENGSIVKRCKLRDGRQAVSRLLKGKDRVLLNRIADGKQEKYRDAVIVVSTKIDEKQMIVEDLDEFWFNDLNKIQAMATSINFM